MSPPAFRATFPGVAYQLGNVCTVCFKAVIGPLICPQMVSSASAQIEASMYHILHMISLHLTLLAGAAQETTIVNGKRTPNYAKVRTTSAWLQLKGASAD